MEPRPLQFKPDAEALGHAGSAIMMRETIHYLTKKLTHSSENEKTHLDSAYAHWPHASQLL